MAQTQIVFEGEEMKSQIQKEHLIKLFETASDALIQTEFSGIDQRSDKVRHALEELSATYDYASRSTSYAFQASQSIQEMRLSKGKVLDPAIDMQPSFQEYTHKIEIILDHLANSLGDVVRQNTAEYFINQGLYFIKIALNDLVIGRKEGK